MSRIGIDTGGTFTDFIWVDAAGRLRLHKSPSTPDDPSRAVLAGLAASGAPDAADVVHGSTVATNALLQRRGAPTALITTAGFADVLAIGRQDRPDLYALVPHKPPPLVPRQWRFEVRERVGADGAVVTPLDEASLADVVERVAAAGVEAVAVCLLFAFLRPEHEQRVGAALRARLPGVHVSLSSDILPEYREYERTATTVINATVAPLMGRYLARLAGQLAPRRLAVMQSNGGVISAALAGAQAARTALSGPAGGVVGARFVAASAGPGGAGYADLITFDMGGTSTDVALCAGSTPTTTEGVIAGLPLRLPLIDIHTVGAGGGSLAYLDAGGALQVGPQSAGAWPGPACYHADYDAWRAMWLAGGEGRGAGEQGSRGEVSSPGTWPLALGPFCTVTDANLVLGRLSADRFLGGQMALHEASARAAVGNLAAEMGATAEGAALAIVRVANAAMERAIRRVSVERGHDPRRFTLLAFGGGGPLHACELAETLGIPRVLVPPTPGVLSALGMLAAAPARDTSQAALRPLAGVTAEWLAAAFAPLVARVTAEMAAEGHDAAALTLHYALDLRYVGQSHELTVAGGEWRVAGEEGSGARKLDSASEAIAAAFHAAHTARYGYARPAAAVELVTLRLSAEAAHTPPPLPAEAPGADDAGATGAGTAAIWFAGGVHETALYERDRLRAGQRFAGPAVVYQYDTTTLLPPGWSAWVDGRRNLVLERC
jgi:N-methylhydantoinase A